MKKILSLLLLTSMLLACLVACSDNDKNDSETSSDEKESSNVAATTPYLENKDFEGYTFTFLGSSVESGICYDDPDEDYSSIHDQAVLQLNSEIMDRFNIKMKDTILEAATISSFVITDAMNPEASYDMGKPHGTENLSSIYSENLAYDIKQLPTVDLTQPWYNQQANDEYSVMGRQFLAAAMFPGLPTSPPLLFHKEMITDLNMELPYKTILDGNWTIEEMMKYVSVGYVDTTGNGRTGDDKYGFTGLTQSIAYFYQGFGGTSTSRDANGAVVPVLSNDTIDAYYSKAYSFYKHPNIWIGNLSNDNPESGHRMFYEGRGMFCYYITVQLSWTDIEAFDYGLGILPKYDLDQEKYVCPAGGSFVMFPVNLANAETTGYLFEAFNEAAYRITYPAVIQESVDFQWLRDEESIEVQKLVDQCLAFDFLKNCDPSATLASAGFIMYCLNNETTPSAAAPMLKTTIEGLFTKFFYPDNK